MRPSRIALTLSLLLLGGCDLFGEGDMTIRASGTVVLAGSGQPLGGISIALDEIQGISHSYAETVQTDSEGRFALRYDALNGFSYDLVINANPISPGYTGRSFRVSPGEPRDLGVIELEERDGN
jgi:hypothetical protein